jgi:D-inositol-3-phosphate glycosyltransferase
MARAEGASGVTRSALLVDWLGRGGIAQASASWALELTGTGVDVSIVTRPGREVDRLAVPVLSPPAGGGRLAAHRGVVQAAVRAVETQRPDVVVVQNFVLPVMEQAVLAAAGRVGARTVLVEHDHRLHSLTAGSSSGLGRLLDGADAVVAHSAFVAEAVASRSRRGATVIPLPVPREMLARPRPTHPPFTRADTDLALTFGVLRRRYKGGGRLRALAHVGVPGWRFALMGAGARAGEGVEAVTGFVDAGVLAAAVVQSDVTLLPYRFATQSGAVVLAQALGSVPVATAVGGIPE